MWIVWDIGREMRDQTKRLHSLALTRPRKSQSCLYLSVLSANLWLVGHSSVTVRSVRDHWIRYHYRAFSTAIWRLAIKLRDNLFKTKWRLSTVSKSQQKSSEDKNLFLNTNKMRMKLWNYMNYIYKYQETRGTGNLAFMPCYESLLYVYVYVFGT